MSEPSVLTYARYFNLTRDYTTDDPLDLLGTHLPPAQHHESISVPAKGCEDLLNTFERAAHRYGSLACDDPLPRSQSAIEYLESCTKLNILDTNKLFEQILPDPHRLRKLKIEEPLLQIGGGNVDKDVRRIKKGIDPEAILDDLLYDEYYEVKRSDQDNTLLHSDVASEVLNWSQEQVEAAMKRDKLEVNVQAMKYLESAMSTTIGQEELSDILLNIYPGSRDTSEDTAYPIAPDDFDIETETETPSPLAFDVSGVKQDDAVQFNSNSTHEPDVPSQLALPFEEEHLLPDSQADKEMDELFRQLTYFDSLGCEVVTSENSQNARGHEEPIAKRRKVQHEMTNDSMKDVEQQRPQIIECCSENLKIEVPVLNNSSSGGLPEINISAMIATNEEFECFATQVTEPGELPFQIPQIHETLYDVNPADFTVLDKFWGKHKSILSSEMVLWKEPGFRLLDTDDADTEELDTETYPIEEWKKDTFVSSRSESNQQEDVSYFFNKPRLQAPVEDQRTKAEEHMHVKEYGFPKDHFSSDIQVKQEPHSPFAERPTLFTGRLHINPLDRSAEHLYDVENVQQVDKGRPKLQECLKFEQSSSKSSIHPSVETQQLLDPVKSLLPVTKRGLRVPEADNMGGFLISDPLSSFLDLRGKQFKSALPRSMPRAAEIGSDPIESTQDSSAKQGSSGSQTKVETSPTSVEPLHQGFIPPKLPLEQPVTIVINNTLLQSKPLLIQFLEQSGNASLTLIYRDLDINQTRGPDLILSPSNCLIITNLQYLDQRPLPGQKRATDLSAVHDQIVTLILNFSRVVVLVHYTVSEDPGIQSKTLSTQTSFAAFCASCSVSTNDGSVQIQPYWLPCLNAASTANMVNSWVWQIIRRYGYRARIPTDPASNLQTCSSLIQDETLWELFLRKAGLNPLAAQVVIGSLKKPVVKDEDGCDKESSWGLRRLVAMSSPERSKMFAEILGARVVSKLNRVLSGVDENELLE